MVGMTVEQVAALAKEIMRMRKVAREAEALALEEGEAAFAAKMQARSEAFSEVLESMQNYMDEF